MPINNPSTTASRAGTVLDPASVGGVLVPLAEVLADGNITGANSILVSSGQRIDTETATALSLGTVTATAVSVGRSGITTTIPGNIRAGDTLGTPVSTASQRWIFTHTPGNGIGIFSYGASTAGPNLNFAKGRGTPAVPTTYVDDDTMGQISFLGRIEGISGDGQAALASIVCFADGVPSAVGPDSPGRLEFQTTPAGGAGIPITRLTIFETGATTFTGAINVTVLDGNVTTGLGKFQMTDGRLSNAASDTANGIALIAENGAAGSAGKRLDIIAGNGEGIGAGAGASMGSGSGQSGAGTGAGGFLDLFSGNGGGSGGASGALTVETGNAAAGVTGLLTFKTGNASGGTNASGAIVIDTGTSGGGTAGTITAGGVNASTVTLGRTALGIVTISSTVTITAGTGANFVTITGGAGSASNGGSIFGTGGGGDANNNGGAATWRGGAAGGTGTAGTATLQGGSASVTLGSTPGDAVLQGGLTAGSATNNGGRVRLFGASGGGAGTGGQIQGFAGSGGPTGAGGAISWTTGNGGLTSGNSGVGSFSTGSATNGVSGTLTFTTGNAGGGTNDSGLISIDTGTSAGGTTGVINIGVTNASAISFGTGASTKTITLGNVTGATAMVYDAGTGGHAFTGDHGFFGTTPVSQPTDLVALTDNSGGSADDTIAAITNVANAGSADVAPTADAIADLAAKYNGLRDRMRTLGLMA